MAATLTPAHIAILRAMAADPQESLPLRVQRACLPEQISALLAAGAIEQRKPKFPGGSWWVLTSRGRALCDNRQAR